MRALLISTYDLGRQPFGLASPAAWLRRPGVEVDCADTSREPLDDEQNCGGIARRVLPADAYRHAAGSAAHRSGPAGESGRRLCAYGLYAPLNASWLGSAA